MGNATTMDHGGHGHEGMGDGGHSMSCSMNMIWNWDPEGICLVFPSLRISSTESLLVSIVFLFALSFSFEALRVRATRDDKLLRVRYASGNSGAFVPTGRRNATLDSSSTGAAGGASGSSSRPRSPAGEPLLPRSAKGINGLGRSVSLPGSVQLRRSLTYVIMLAISFYIMLIVMTYNAVLIGSVLAGAFAGHFFCHREIDSVDGDDKGLACH